jgi:hypothetical protein
MITVNLGGGLGNQIFQYAAGRALSLVTGRPLSLNIAKYSTNKERRAFSLFEAVEDGGSIQVITDHGMLLRKHERLLKRANLRMTKKGSLVVSEGNFFNCLSHRYDSRDLLLDGCFQDLRFFLGFKIEQLITPRETDISLAGRQGRKVLAVHVRRGDYLLPQHRIHGVTPWSFYHQALGELRRLFPGALVALFSDDREVKPPFPIDVRVSELMLKDTEEFLLLAKSDALVIPNSTFAWWAAALSASAFVYAPKRWAVRRDAPESFFLNHWKILG